MASGAAHESPLSKARLFGGVGVARLLSDLAEFGLELAAGCGLGVCAGGLLSSAFSLGVCACGLLGGACGLSVCAGGLFGGAFSLGVGASLSVCASGLFGIAFSLSVSASGLLNDASGALGNALSLGILVGAEVSAGLRVVEPQDLVLPA